MEVELMTISVDAYFARRTSDRKKEPRYLATINKDSCTSCNSCATVCPVDCIYEVVSPIPSQSYHQIDTSRCIGCQLCYRVPQESSDRYTLEICPWNAIDMLHNPNVKPDEPLLGPYWLGTEEDLPWSKLEEYGYQLFLDGEVFLPAGAPELHEILAWFDREEWYYGDDERCSIAREADRNELFVRFEATPEGRALLDVIFPDYAKIFMD
jgi:ferredoxin